MERPQVYSQFFGAAKVIPLQERTTAVLEVPYGLVKLGKRLDKFAALEKLELP